MSGYGHLYMTMHGEWQDPWAPEKAQIGIRILPRLLGDSSGPIVPIQDKGPVVLTNVQRDLTDFNAVQTFSAEVPGVALASWTEYTDDLAKDALAYLGAIKAVQVAKFRWTEIRIAPIEVGTGKYLAPASVWQLKTPIPGTNSTALPPQDAICASLRTQIVGRRGRGRMYIPAVGQGTATADGKVSSSAQTTIANATKTFVNALGDLPGTDLFQNRVVIMSAASTTGVLPAQVRVGDQYDTQRRREEQERETYLSLAL